MPSKRISKSTEEVVKAPVGRREWKRQETRRLILEAATGLFSTKGYEQTSVEDIAESANFAKGTFYYNFESKEELLVAIFSDHIAEVVERGLRRLQRAETADRVLEWLFTTEAQWTESNRELAIALFTTVIPPMPPFVAAAEHEEGPVFDRTAEFPKFLSRLAELGQSEGVFRSDVTATDLSSVFLSTHLIIQRETLYGKTSRSALDRVRKWLNLALDGLRP